MRRRYVYLNLLMITSALVLPTLFLRFGAYHEKKYMRLNGSITDISPKFEHFVPSFDEFAKYLREFSSNFSQFITLYELGSTNYTGREKMPIYNVVMSSGLPKPIIVFIGGFYASDLSSPLTLMNCFTDWISKTEVTAQLLPIYDYHFIPLVNPEGYRFVYQEMLKGEYVRSWKNMHDFNQGKSVNILNNFDNNFGKFRQDGSSDRYGGDEPFTEVESLILKNYILEIKDNVAGVFLLFSSNDSAAVTYPYAHTMEKHDSWVLQEQLATNAVERIKTTSVNSIRIIPAAELGLEGGRFDDWLIDFLKNIIVLNVQMDYSLKKNEKVGSLMETVHMVEALLEKMVLLLYNDDNDEYVRYYLNPFGEKLKPLKVSWKEIRL